MKTKVAIFIFISIFLVSCAPETPTQESEVDVLEVATEAIDTEVPTTQEPIAIEEPVATELPAESPTETAIACVTLLTPINGTEVPPVGKVTFSWTPLEEAGKYILIIVLPSSEFVRFETDQTFRDRYMEAFVAGGEYQWQVVALSDDGSEICVSKFAVFEKIAYEKPKDNRSNENVGGDDGPGGGGGSVCEVGKPCP